MAATPSVDAQIVPDMKPLGLGGWKAMLKMIAAGIMAGAKSGWFTSSSTRPSDAIVAHTPRPAKIASTVLEWKADDVLNGTMSWERRTRRLMRPIRSATVPLSDDFLLGSASVPFGLRNDAQKSIAIIVGRARWSWCAVLLLRSLQT
eukprot:2551901-Prymnesium_polylepis.1